MASRNVAGRYLEACTWLHGTQAGAKLLALLVLSVGCFAAGAAGVALMAAVLVVAALSCRMGPRELVATLRPAAVVLLLALVFQALRLDGSGDVALVGLAGVSAAAALRAALAVARIACMVALVLLVSATTTTTELADALSSALSPLVRAGVPVGDVALVVAVSLRFIPEVLQTAGQIADAHRSRGARLDGGGVRQRLGAWSTVLVALVMTLIRRADQLAQAMTDRGYRGSLPLPERGHPNAASVLLVVASLALAVLCVVVSR